MRKIDYLLKAKVYAFQGFFKGPKESIVCRLILPIRNLKPMNHEDVLHFSFDFGFNIGLYLLPTFNRLQTTWFSRPNLRVPKLLAATQCETRGHQRRGRDAYWWQTLYESFLRSDLHAQ